MITQLPVTASIVDDIVRAVKPTVRESLNRTATSWFDGANGADIGSSFRIDMVRALPGLLLPAGFIGAKEVGIRSPVNTTWLQVATPAGVIDSTVNCARMLQSLLYRLSGDESPYVGGSQQNPSLLDDEEHAELRPESQFMWAIEWKHLWDAERKRKEGIRAIARLLYGVADLPKRRFLATIERDIVVVDSRVIAASSVSAPPEAKGPSPLTDLTPRS